MDHVLLGLLFLTAYLLTVNTKNRKALKRFHEIEAIHMQMMDRMQGDINELRTIIYRLKYHGKETKTTEEESSDAG